MMAEQDVELEFVGKVAYVRLNRPAQLNAFSSALIGSLSDALDTIDDQDDCRVIVITGNGKAFSAGGDLKEFQQHLANGDHAGFTALIGRVAGTLTRLEENLRPVIAAVGGVAVA